MSADDDLRASAIASSCSTLPPSSCRTSPPLGGRLAASASPSQRREAKLVTADLPPVGEMSGRTEGARQSATSTIRQVRERPMRRALILLRRRLLGAIPVLLLVVIGTFFLLEARRRRRGRCLYRLDRRRCRPDRSACASAGASTSRPLTRLAHYLWSLAHLDLGWSVTFSRPILRRDPRAAAQHAAADGQRHRAVLRPRLGARHRRRRAARAAFATGCCRSARWRSMPSPASGSAWC